MPIDEEPVLINSALVPAQNRQRLYWVGKREPDGTYSQVHIEQPEDRGILLRDILETGHPLREKAYALLSTAHGATAEDAIARRQRNAAAEPVQVKPLTEREMEYMLRETKDGRNHFDFDYHHDASRDKSSCVTANTHRGVPYNVLVEPVDGEAEPAAMRQVGRRINEQGHRDDYNEAIPHFQYFEVNDNPQKTNCLSTVEKDNMIAVPVRVGDMPNAEGVIRGGQAHRIYDSDGKAVTLTARPNGKVERSHREDQKRFCSCHLFYSLDDFAKQLSIHNRRSNRLPVRPLHWFSPVGFAAHYVWQTYIFFAARRFFHKKMMHWFCLMKNPDEKLMKDAKAALARNVRAAFFAGYRSAVIKEIPRPAISQSNRKQ